MSSNRVLYIKPYKNATTVSMQSIQLKQPPKMKEKQKFDIIPAVITFLANMIVCMVQWISTGNFPVYYMIFPIMMIIMSATTHWRNTNKDIAKYEKDIAKYITYLGDIEKEWERQSKEVSNYYNETYPEFNEDKFFNILNHSTSYSIKEGVKIDEVNVSKLWSVMPEHVEFLTMRVGTYTWKVEIELEVDENDNDVPLEIREKIKELSEKKGQAVMPYIIDLKNNPNIAFIVSRKKEEAVKDICCINNAILGVITNNAYDDVGLAVLCRTNSERYFKWMRWLPHVWDEREDFRYFCSSDKNKTDFLERLESILKERENNSDKRGYRSQYIVIVEDVKSFFEHSVSKYFSSTNEIFGVKVIFIIEEGEKDETEGRKYVTIAPSICSVVVDIRNKKIYENKTKGEITFEPDICKCNEGGYYKIKTDNKPERIGNIFVEYEHMARALSSIEVRNGEKGNKLPDIITFFDLLEANALMEDEIIKCRWVNRLSHKKDIGLNVPIGVRADGSHMCVDLKDGVDGAHAIIAGMTGSGKTELLQTLILSLCINYSPEQVNFAFIDFKEGGMAMQFKGIPHESGILTNQDENIAYLANRAIAMLRQEKKYRGNLLSEYGLDINRYHKKFYNQKENNTNNMVPLPHLFVVIDESAEVAEQFHGFMKEMVSIARVGRSMGIHLILSTQNPSRTVDSQIFDNANLKICMSVLSEEESNAILKTKEAAYIVNRGRAILMTGNGARKEMFQSAYTGAATESNAENLGMEVMKICSDGNIQKLSSDSNVEEGKTQLNKVIDILKELEAPALVHKVFSETLGEDIKLSDVNEDTQENIRALEFATVIGKIDVWKEQQIQDLIIDFDECRNIAIFGSSRSGKTTLAETILLDIVTRYSANKVQCIVVANGASTMSKLRNANFVAEFISDDDYEKMYRLPAFLMSEVQKRLDDDRRGIKKQRTRIVVFIDELQRYLYTEELGKVLAAGSAQVGIHLVAIWQNDRIPRNLIKFFGAKVALQIHDDLYSYEIAFRGIIEKYAGRGVVVTPSVDAIEMQAFQPIIIEKDDNEKLKEVSLKNYKDDKWNKHIENETIKIRCIADALPELSAYFDFENYKRDMREDAYSELPIGVYYESLEGFSISKRKKAYLFSICGDEDMRGSWVRFFGKYLNRLGKVIFYGYLPKTEEPLPLEEMYVSLPEEEAIRADIEKRLEENRHVFIVIHYEEETFYAKVELHKKFIKLLETEYKGRVTLIVITSEQMAMKSNAINRYCLTASSIIAIGGRHDNHVRLSGVRMQSTDIPKREAYVSVSSTKFEKVVLRDDKVLIWQ